MKVDLEPLNGRVDKWLWEPGPPYEREEPRFRFRSSEGRAALTCERSTERPAASAPAAAVEKLVEPRFADDFTARSWCRETTPCWRDASVAIARSLVVEPVRLEYDLEVAPPRRIET